MLKMGCRFAVTGANGPTVLVKPDITLSHRYHGFYGQAHTCLQHHTITASPIIGHLRILVHLTTNAVSCEFTYKAIALSLTMRLHRITDVAQMMASHSILYTQIEGLFGRLQQLTDFSRNLPHAKSVAGVTIEPVQQRTTVDRNDVTLFQDCFLVGDTMHDNVVDRCADTGRKRSSVRVRKPLECRNCAMVTYELIGNLIQLEGRYTRFYMSGQFAKRFTNKLVRLAH